MADQPGSGVAAVAAEPWWPERRCLNLAGVFPSSTYQWGYRSVPFYEGIPE